jgi:hypothetical protein
MMNPSKCEILGYKITLFVLFLQELERLEDVSRLKASPTMQCNRSSVSDYLRTTGRNNA